MNTLEKIVIAIVEEIGLPAVLKLVTARASPDVAQAALAGELLAIRAAADAEAKAVLGEP